MKFCEKCGKPIEQEDRFCLYCGAPVRQVTAQADNIVTDKPAHEPVKKSSEKKSKKKAIIISVVAVILAALIAVSGIIFLPELLGLNKTTEESDNAFGYRFKFSGEEFAEKMKKIDETCDFDEGFNSLDLTNSDDEYDDEIKEKITKYTYSNAERVGKGENPGAVPILSVYEESESEKVCKINILISSSYEQERIDESEKYLKALAVELEMLTHPNYSQKDAENAVTEIMNKSKIKDNSYAVNNVFESNIMSRYLLSYNSNLMHSYDVIPMSEKYYKEKYEKENAESYNSSVSSTAASVDKTEEPSESQTPETTISEEQTTARTETTESKSGDDRQQSVGSERVSFGDYSLLLPDDWTYEKEGDYIHFYSKYVHDRNVEYESGFIFSIEKTKGNEDDYPGLAIKLGEKDGYNYYVVYPTGMGIIQDDTARQKFSEAMEKDDGVIDSFEFE